jgi:peptidoglycan/xylan/chitin deacetylase (PgdA/CDA1 family)
MARCTREIERLSSVRPRFYRPPEGKLDVATVLASLRHRHRLMLWSTDSGDWQARSPETAVEKAEALSARLAARPAQREILLFHDYNPHTLVMLER